MADRIVHIAGHGVRVGSKYRQRCARCQAVIIDGDLSLEATAPGCEPHRPHFFETGDLVEVATDGGMTATTLVPHRDGDELPSRACAAPPRHLRVVHE